MDPVGIYVHVPFCRRKCIYCGFYSLPRSGGDFSAYLEALDRECAMRRGEYGVLPVDTVFFGGGTPSLLEPEDITAAIGSLRRNFDLSGVSEFTFESNPGTLTKAKLDAMRSSGVNRLSMGLQSSDEGLLHLIGRVHDRKTFEESFRLARGAGFDNISVDMIFGLPGETLAQVEADIDYLLSVHPEHISAYSLMIDPGTPLESMLDSGLLTLPSEDDERAMYYAYRRRLADAGYLQYEISNWCLPGRESRHNIRYWRDRDYLGLGPAAHSLMGNRRFANPESVDGWISALSNGCDPSELLETRSRNDHMTEFMFTGLRMLAGVQKTEFRQKFGCDIDDEYPGVAAKLEARGLLAQDGESLRLSDLGLDLANQVFLEFVK